MDNGDVLPEILQVFLNVDVGVVSKPDVQPPRTLVDLVQPVLLSRGAVERVENNRVIFPELVEILVLFPV